MVTPRDGTLNQVLYLQSTYRVLWRTLLLVENRYVGFVLSLDVLVCLFRVAYLYLDVLLLFYLLLLKLRILGGLSLDCCICHLLQRLHIML